MWFLMERFGTFFLPRAPQIPEFGESQISGLDYLHEGNVLPNRIDLGVSKMLF